MTDNTETLRALKAQIDAADNQYRTTLARIESRKDELRNGMQALNDEGCTSLAEAEALIAELQGEIDTKAEQIRGLL